MGRRRRTGLIVFTGCMFAGKTDRLIHELEVRVNHAHQKVQVFSPAIDTRTGLGNIIAKDGYRHSFPAQTIAKAADILDLVAEDTDLVAVDEAQFLDAGLVEVCRRLMRHHEVFVAGRTVRADAGNSRDRPAGGETGGDLRYLRRGCPLHSAIGERSAGALSRSDRSARRHRGRIRGPLLAAPSG